MAAAETEPKPFLPENLPEIRFRGWYARPGIVPALALGATISVRFPNGKVASAELILDKQTWDANPSDEARMDWLCVSLEMAVASLLDAAREDSKRG